MRRETDMKTRTSISTMNALKICLFAVGVIAVMPGPARAGVSFSVTPATVSNTYAGNVTLVIGGLTNGESVTVQKYLDLNGDGVVDGGDLLWQQLRLTDGQATVIGGVTNLAIPGDSDAVAGQITTHLQLQNDFVQTIAGKYLFVLSSPAGRFAAVTNSLTVTNFGFAQQLSGHVTNRGTNVANALVLLFQPGPGGENEQGGAVADGNGAYVIKAPPGNYLLAVFKEDFVCDLGLAPRVPLGSGQMLVADISNCLVAATQRVAGQVVDASNPQVGLPGLLVPMTAKGWGSFLALCTTDGGGHFTAGVVTNLWGISPSAQALNAYGYLRLQNSVKVDTSTGSVAGVTIALPRANALFYGTVKDALGNPLAHAQLYASDQSARLYEADGVFTDGGGNYFAGAVGGMNWAVGISNDGNPALTNYVISAGTQASLSPGQAFHFNFTALAGTSHITGTVLFNGTAVAGAQVNASANLNGTYQADGYTDSNGHYSLSVPNGTWGVSLNCQGGTGSLDDILGPGNYQCPDMQSAAIAGTDGVLNFAILPGNTSSGTLFGYVWDEYGNAIVGVRVQASGGTSWTAVTDTNGYYSFNVSPGTWDASVSCADLTAQGYSCVGDQNVYVSAGGMSEVDFQVPFCLPLQVTTTALPDGMVGFAYAYGNPSGFGLENSGCNPPYTWSLTPGSLPLPDGMTLSAGGVLGGTPAVAGTHYVSVRVTDAGANTADQVLSIVVWPMGQITNSTLPAGEVGVPYSAVLGATGGEGGYFGWYIDSGALPAGLTISDGGNGTGLISGAPSLAGTYTFTVGVIDNSGYVILGACSLTIRASSLAITTAALPGGVAGVPYSVALQAGGGTPPYSWSIALGSQPLPPALTLATNGLLSGVPLAPGTNSFIVRVTDAAAGSVTRSFTLTNCSGLELTSPAYRNGRFEVELSHAQAGTSYTLQARLDSNSTTWTNLLTTNAAVSTLLLIDPFATNTTRLYRVKVGL